MVIASAMPALHDKLPFPDRVVHKLHVTRASPPTILSAITSSPGRSEPHRSADMSERARQQHASLSDLRRER